VCVVWRCKRAPRGLAAAKGWLLRDDKVVWEQDYHQARESVIIFDEKSACRVTKTIAYLTRWVATDKER